MGLVGSAFEWHLDQISEELDWLSISLRIFDRLLDHLLIQIIFTTNQGKRFILQLSLLLFDYLRAEF